MWISETSFIKIRFAIHNLSVIPIKEMVIFNYMFGDNRVFRLILF